MEPCKETLILEAANKVFLKYGFQKTSMDDIAREAMIGKGTIYYYFESKEDIFVAILKKVNGEINVILREKISQATTFSAKFEIFLTEPFNRFMSQAKLIYLVLNEDSPVFLTKLTDFKHETIGFLKQILSEIFEFGAEQGVLKERYSSSIENIVNVIFKWMMMSGEYVKLNLKEDKIQELKKDYLTISEVFLNGLLKQEEIN
jgi:AcrR family transcriptional regulator